MTSEKIFVCSLFLLPESSSQSGRGRGKLLGRCNWLMCKQRSSHTANPYYKITTSRERNVGILSGRLQSQAYGLLHSVVYFSFEK